jgi:hypothetical protein
MFCAAFMQLGGLMPEFTKAFVHCRKFMELTPIGCFFLIRHPRRPPIDSIFPAAPNDEKEMS